MKTLIIVLMFFAVTAPAYAYIDAGSGSYLFQMAMAGLMALAFTVKLAWGRITGFVKGVFKGTVVSEKPAK